MIILLPGEKNQMENFGEPEILPWDQQVINDFYQVNPEQKDKFKIQKIKFALTEEQRNDLLSNALEINPKHYRLIKTQLESGMRVNELCNLAIDQVNFTSNEITIETRSEKTRYVAEFTTKTKSSNRIIPITKELRKILLEEIGKRKNGYVFESNKHGKYQIRSVIKMINTYAKSAKTIRKNIGSHALRRTYASYLLQKNVKIGKISKTLGHATIRTTMIYLYDIIDTSGFDEIRNAISEMNQI